MNKLFSISVFLFILSFVSLYPISAQVVETETAASLCAKLKEIKTLPHDSSDLDADPIYASLYKKGKTAIPCLIEKITDLTEMPSPVCPAQPEVFRVGDAAVFILFIVTEQEGKLSSILPPEYADRWKTDGVYAYYDYASTPANRKKMQDWWQDWAAKNLDKK